MRAIILSAGRGRRLPKHLSLKPKVLLKIGNETILEKQIKNFELMGIKKIALVTGYNSRYLNKLNLKCFHNGKWSTTNMVFSLTKADSWLKKYKCIISYGDILYEKKALKNLINNKNKIAISYDVNWKVLWQKRFKNIFSDAETFKVKGGLIKEIGKKTDSIKNIDGQYMGLMKFNPSGWNILKRCLKKEFKGKYQKLYLTDIFQRLIEINSQIYGVKFKGRWAEVDSLKDYKIMKKIFLK